MRALNPALILFFELWHKIKSDAVCPKPWRQTLPVPRAFSKPTTAGRSDEAIFLVFKIENPTGCSPERAISIARDALAFEFSLCFEKLCARGD